MAITFEGVIVIFYWVFLYDSTEAAAWTEWRLIRNHINHTIPISLLFLDFILNTIPFTYRHLPHCLALILIYGFGVNLPITKISGEPIYKVLTWDNNATIYYVSGLMALFFVSFFTWYFLALFKNKYYNLIILAKKALGKVGDDVESGKFYKALN
jgi:hypothetical protein